MSAYRRDFDETKYMSISIKGDELQKNIMEVGKQLKIVSKKKKNLIMDLYTMKNI